MDKATQLSLQSSISKALLLLIAGIGGWLTKKYGVHVGAETATILHDLFAFIVPIVALSIASWWDHSKIKEASLKIDTALSLPSGTTNAQLNEYINKAVEQAKKNGSDARDEIQEVTRGVVTK